MKILKFILTNAVLYVFIMACASYADVQPLNGNYITTGQEVTTTGQAATTTSAAATTEPQVIIKEIVTYIQVPVYIEKVVPFYIEKAPRFTPDVGGYYKACQDGKFHLWKDGILATNEAVKLYKDANLYYYADSDGLPLNDIENSIYQYYNYVTDKYGNSYMVTYYGSVGEGWVYLYKKQGNADYCYCDFNTGIIIKNAKVDGFTLDQYGKVISSELTSANIYILSSRMGKEAKTIEYLPQ